ncbi:MAG: sensor histidine kinase, partial [Pseudomonadota bacterium]
LTARDDMITFAGFIPTDGNMTCASTGKPFSFANSPDLLRLNSDPRPAMTVNPKGPISGESVLIFSQPFIDETGTVLGYVSLSVPHRALVQRTSTSQDDSLPSAEPLALVTFDGDGTVLTAVYGIATVAERLPAARPLADFVGKPPMTFVARTPSGDMRTFAVLAIVPEQLYLLGSWPVNVANDTSLSGVVPLWVIPLAMWVASMLVAWLTAEHQVLRHVRALRRSIIAFAGGSRTVAPPDLADAPNELRDVGDAYERMMSSVIRDEAELENSLHQKGMLLREVHHRVKNNLQLIASIMNLQMRKSVTPEARHLLKGLHDRVMSLATVHRELYQTSGLADVEADELLQTIVAQVMRMGASSERQLETRTSFDRIRLTPDQAVPLSLMLTEALTNALKHSGQRKDAGATSLSVSFHHAAPGRAVLEVTNLMAAASDPNGTSAVDSTGLGQQLLAAFASQLSGVLEVGVRDGTYVVRLDFPVQVAVPEGDADSADGWIAAPS